MNRNAHDEKVDSDAFWDAPVVPEAAAIDAAIRNAALPSGNRFEPAFRPGSLPEDWRHNTSGANAYLPPAADDIVLDVLPISRIADDGLGRINVEPDPASLDTWNRANRAAAEHLVAWLNTSGTASDAIEQAIMGGERRFGRLSEGYDEALATSGYNRSAPEVLARDNELRELHADIQHARDVLGDIRDRRELPSRPQTADFGIEPPSMSYDRRDSRQFGYLPYDTGGDYEL